MQIVKTCGAASLMLVAISQSPQALALKRCERGLTRTGVVAPTPPTLWPEEVQEDYRDAFAEAQTAPAPERVFRPESPVLSLDEVQTAVVDQYGLRGTQMIPEVDVQEGGKLTLTYTGILGKRIVVKMNATRGQFYFTIIERMNGVDRYMMLFRMSNGRWSGLRPCVDMGLCHYGVRF